MFIGYSDERSSLATRRLYFSHLFIAFNNSCPCARRMSPMNLVYDLTHYEFRRKLRFFHVSSSRNDKYNNFVHNSIIATQSTKSKEKVRPSRHVFYVSLFQFSFFLLFFPDRKECRSTFCNLFASAGSSNCFKTARNNQENYYKIYTGASLLLSLGPWWHAHSRGTNKELQTKR